MIYLFHGDDLAKTREAIFNFIEKAKNPGKTELDITALTPEDLYTQVFAKDLFGGSRCMILDISKAGKMDLEPYLDKLKDKPSDLLLIIFTDKALTKANILIKNPLQLPIKVFEFNTIPEGKTFDYVDALFNKNRTRAYSELNKLMRDGEDSFKIMGAMQFALRNILFIKFEAPQANSINPYVRSKAVSQAKNFTQEQLLKLTDEIYEIEKGAKTGEVPPELVLTLLTEKVLNS